MFSIKYFQNSLNRGFHDIPVSKDQKCKKLSAIRTYIRIHFVQIAATMLKTNFSIKPASALFIYSRDLVAFMFLSVYSIRTFNFDQISSSDKITVNLHSKVSMLPAAQSMRLSLRTIDN